MVILLVNIRHFLKRPMDLGDPSRGREIGPFFVKKRPFLTLKVVKTPDSAILGPKMGPRGCQNGYFEVPGPQNGPWGSQNDPPGPKMATWGSQKCHFRHLCVFPCIKSGHFGPKPSKSSFLGPPWGQNGHFAA